MQVITAIEGGQQLAGVTGIANHGVEIDDAVEIPRGSNPLIHGLAVSFAQGSGMVIA